MQVSYYKRRLWWGWKKVVSNQYCAYFYDRFIAKWNVNLKSPDIYNPYWCNFGEEGEKEYVPAVSDGCFSKDTLISTKKGQKKITDLSNDEILVFDHENGILAYTNTYFVNVINDKTFNMIKLNDGILPAINVKLDALEEERRLCYAVLTRAKEYLHVSPAYEHYISGVSIV